MAFKYFHSVRHFFFTMLAYVEEKRKRKDLILLHYLVAMVTRSIDSTWKSNHANFTLTLNEYESHTFPKIWWSHQSFNSLKWKLLFYLLIVMDILLIRHWYYYASLMLLCIVCPLQFILLLYNSIDLKKKKVHCGTR